MPRYLIYFNQQWVPDRPEEWFHERGRLARAVTEEMKEAGVYVFAGGLEEQGRIFHADPAGATPTIVEGRYAETDQWLGGFALVDVADDEAAAAWAAKVVEACGWAHEVRRFG